MRNGRMPSFLRVLGGVSLLAWWVLPACAVTNDTCGDGVRDADERCDDGNRLDGDGCSASCQPDDDPPPPGDERAGYFVCREKPFAMGITCEPGSICCLTDGPVCVSAEQGCPDPLNVVSCDGPEDCARADYHCETLSHGTSCTSSEGSATWCHADADCAGVFPWLPNGVCGLNGVCDFSAPSGAN